MFCPPAGLFGSTFGAASDEGLVPGVGATVSAPPASGVAATGGSGFASWVPTAVAVTGGSGFGSVGFPAASRFTWEDELAVASAVGCTGCPQRPSPAQGYMAAVGPFL